MKNIVRCGVAAALAAACAAAPASASDTGSSLAVNASVTANCTVSTAPVAFGTVDVTSGQAVLGTGSISVTCTNGTAWTAAADAGAGADISNRKMMNGANSLNYSLFVDSARTQLWGDGVEAATALISDTGTGTAQTKTVYGLIPGGQTGVEAGEYADAIQVTVTY